MEQFEDCDLSTLVKARCKGNCIFRTMTAKHYNIVREFFGRDSFQSWTNKGKTEEERNEMSRTLIEEAIIRREEPVQGCYGKLERSEQEVKILKEEVQSLKTIFFLKTTAEQQPENEAVDSYNNILEFARANLPAVHPAQLALALSIASFHYGRGALIEARDLAYQTLVSVGNVDTIFEGSEIPEEVFFMKNWIYGTRTLKPHPACFKTISGDVSV